MTANINGALILRPIYSIRILSRNIDAIHLGAQLLYSFVGNVFIKRHFTIDKTTRCNFQYAIAYGLRQLMVT